MDFSKEKALVKRLATHTQLGNVDWRPSVRSGVFEVSFRDSTIRIGAAPSPGLVPSVREVSVQLVNGEGEVVEVLTDADLTNATGSNEEAPQVGWFQLMLSLYEAARRRAQGAEKVLDEILEELDEAIQN